ncbi:MAG: LD-carboxypeptidase [Verrucomicrobiales bacterium]|nr:LD-carboxypeptidase [Verrucomicrobiales bacterium]
MNALHPPRLRRGDVIGLVSPASPPRSAAMVEGSVRYLEGLGYRVAVGAHVLARHGFSAGTDADRLADLNAMIRDPRIKALFALRGGNGCLRLLRDVDYRALSRRPKILVGYSDLTFLQLAVWRRCRLVSFSGPMPAVEFWHAPDPYTEEMFWGLLTSRARRRVLTFPADAPGRTVRPGVGEGRLLGGCLSLVTTLLGTPFAPRFDGALLFAEDVGELPHRLHRLWTQLDLAGVLRRLNGVLAGRFTGAEPRPGEAHLTQAEILEETLGEVGIPVLADLPYGHIPRKLTLPQGVLARLDAGRRRVTLLESAVV